MTYEELEAIAARANAATPSPWYWMTKESRKGQRFLEGWIVSRATREPWGNDECVFYGDDYGDINGSDEDFVCAAREDAPALVAEILSSTLANIQPYADGARCRQPSDTMLKRYRVYVSVEVVEQFRLVADPVAY